MQNYNNKIAAKVYDFSERHVEYATSDKFLNGAINEMGFSRNVGNGGINAMIVAYLTNGMGAVKEEDMPYLETSDLINISEIQNKKIATQVYDTQDLPTPETMSVEQLKEQVKEYVSTYGGIMAGVHEYGEAGEESGSSCLNEQTGAIYCKDISSHARNHMIVIIGWDDDYAIENFAEGQRPQNKGAWIAKDSHGANAERTFTFTEFKNMLFETYKEDFEKINITSASAISDDLMKQLAEANKFVIEGDKVFKLHNDDGYLHISYEDANIYNELCGISKSEDKIDYENIYQYNECGYSNQITSTKSNKNYLANVFDKKTSGKEYITQVSLVASEAYTCKVYVNTNGTSKNKDDMKLVQLKAGESETINAGYHTLEFAEPVEITGNKFVVIIEIQGTRSNQVVFWLESNYPEYYKKVTGQDLPSNAVMSAYGSVKVEVGKGFLTFDSELTNENTWFDTSTLESASQGKLPNGNLTIKAFTVSNINDESLKEIKITTPPNKTTYLAGENFDKEGMVVTAYYNNGTNKIITDYNISNGTDLKEGQKSITISYEDKQTTQAITVVENSVVKLEIISEPEKKEYKAGHDFETKGLVVKATYKDGTTKEITDYTISDGTNLKNGQTEVTVSYGGQTVKQPITVQANPLKEIRIKTPPTKTTYVVGQDFDKKGMVVEAEYEDGLTKQVTDYIIESGTKLTKEQTSVTVKYEDKTIEQAITVEEKQITLIKVKSNPSKTKYIQNKEELKLDGGILEVTYNDGTTEEIDMTSENVTVSGFSNEKIGKVTITLTYEGKTATCEVEIVEEKLPKNSDFTSANCNVKTVNYYTFTDTTKKEYSIIDVEIQNVKRSNSEKYEYYYYLSSSQTEANIENWVKITEEQKSNDKLAFTIDTNKVANYAEISNSDVVYLYIKEVAIEGGNQAVLVSQSIKMENDKNTNFEIYRDNKKIENVKPGTTVQPGSKDDNTIAGGVLPKAGLKSIMIIVAIVLAAGIIAYIRYKKLSDIK